MNNLSKMETTMNAAKVLPGRIILLGGDSRLKTIVGVRSGDKIVSAGQAGWLVYGPYEPLTAGQYQVIFHCQVGKSGLAGAHMDVVADKGSTVITKCAFEVPDEDGCFVVPPISLNASCSDFEVRVWVTENTDLQVSMIEIAPWLGEQEEVNTNSEDILLPPKQSPPQLSRKEQSLLAKAQRKKKR